GVEGGGNECFSTLVGMSPKGLSRWSACLFCFAALPPLLLGHMEDGFSLSLLGSETPQSDWIDRSSRQVPPKTHVTNQVSPSPGLEPCWTTTTRLETEASGTSRRGPTIKAAMEPGIDAESRHR